MSMTSTTKHSLYDILNIPEPQHGTTLNLSKDELKSSYHRTLLLHHPDKAPRILSSSVPAADEATVQVLQYSIDEIVYAYRVLSDPESRRQYDAELRASRKLAPATLLGVDLKATHLGIEVVDLDDLHHNEADNSWSKTCRCGNEIGYCVTEQELESESDIGEIYVGCQGCSLFIKVLFGIASDDGQKDPVTKTS